jgi:hypothetical protein
VVRPGTDFTKLAPDAMLWARLHHSIREGALVGQAVDPVATPSAYQELILSYLGEDDPAAIQASTPASVRALIHEADAILRERPNPAEWSVLECVGHLVDSELIVSVRYRWIVAEDEPEIAGYDQDLWVSRLRHGLDDPAALVAVFEALRGANLELWARLPLEDRDRIGRHLERGAESYDLTFRLSAGHDRFHLAQARRAIDAVRRQG